MTTPHRRVHLVLPTEHDFARRIMTGIVQHVRTTFGDRWLLSHSVPQSGGHLPGVDGVIVGVSTASLAEQVRQFHGPAINVSAGLADTPCPRVMWDNHGVGRVAGEYLLERGYRRFAYVHQPDHWFGEQRLAGFRHALQAHGLEPAVFDHGLDHAWLQQTPKPAAVFAAADDRARPALNLCLDLGYDVPGDVAIVGVNNDALVCETTAPPLSSVDVPAHAVGIAAARRLAQLFDGEAVPTETTLPVRRVVQRRSSDVLAASDPLLRQAMDVIRNHVEKPLNVAELCRELATDRRTLERRFRDELGRAPLSVLHQFRLDRARRLLIDTDQPLHAIADQCGYRTTNRFVEAFHRYLNQTPTAYRDHHTSPDPPPATPADDA